MFMKISHAINTLKDIGDHKMYSSMIIHVICKKM